MSLITASLNSGSNGNCYYIGNGEEAVLVDAGISCRETERRMKALGLSLQGVKAIFISHEHADHILGVEVLARKYQLPVYITPPTLSNSRLKIAPGLLQSFRAYQPVAIGSLSVTAFPKQHDAADPHSFTIRGNGITIGVFTDIGAPCKHVVSHFTQCHAVFLESNYDEEMLEKGRYPYPLKRRISGDKGHLSNLQALELFRRHRPAHMTHVFLSHLSKDNNKPEIADQLFRRESGEVHVSVASRHQASEVFTINGSPAPVPVPASPGYSYQSSLF